MKAKSFFSERNVFHTLNCMAILIAITATTVFATQTEIQGDLDSEVISSDITFTQLVLSGMLTGDLSGQFNLSSSTTYDGMTANSVGLTHGNFTFNNGTCIIKGVYVGGNINKGVNEGHFESTESMGSCSGVRYSGILYGTFTQSSPGNYSWFNATYRGSRDNADARVTELQADYTTTKTNYENRIQLLEQFMANTQITLNQAINTLNSIQAFLNTIGGSIPQQPWCGNNVCEGFIGETSITCPADCTDGGQPSEIYIMDGWRVTCPTTFNNHTISSCRAEMFKGGRSLANKTLEPNQVKQVNQYNGYTQKLYGTPSD